MITTKVQASANCGKIDGPSRFRLEADVGGVREPGDGVVGPADQRGQVVDTTNVDHPSVGLETKEKNKEENYKKI